MCPFLSEEHGKDIPASPVIGVHSGRGKLFATKDQITKETKVLAMSLLNHHNGI